MTARVEGSPASRQAKSDLAATYDLHEETYEAASDRLRQGINAAHIAVSRSIETAGTVLNNLYRARSHGSKIV